MPNGDSSRPAERRQLAKQWMSVLLPRLPWDAGRLKRDPSAAIHDPNWTRGLRLEFEYATPLWTLAARVGS
jgi:hypothetical protein